MRNYLQRLSLGRKAGTVEIQDAIENAMNETNDLESLKDADIVLSDKLTRTYYERTHVQYEAINAALSCLDAELATDTHRWPERLVEFEYETKEPFV